MLQVLLIEWWGQEFLTVTKFGRMVICWCESLMVSGLNQALALHADWVAAMPDGQGAREGIYWIDACGLERYYQKVWL